MITNAASVSISSCIGVLPNMSGAVMGWMQSTPCKLLVKSIVDFQLYETSTDLTIMAVRQPFNARQLLIRPEGQRSWSWFTLHTMIDADFNLDDKIIFDGVEYRVMEKFHWKDHGFYEYHIVQNFTGGSN